MHPHISQLDNTAHVAAAGRLCRPGHRWPPGISPMASPARSGGILATVTNQSPRACSPNAALSKDASPASRFLQRVSFGLGDDGSNEAQAAAAGAVDAATLGAIDHSGSHPVERSDASENAQVPPGVGTAGTVDRDDDPEYSDDDDDDEFDEGEDEEEEEPAVAGASGGAESTEADAPQQRAHVFDLRAVVPRLSLSWSQSAWHGLSQPRAPTASGCGLLGV